MYRRLGQRSAPNDYEERRFASVETVKAVVASHLKLHWLAYGCPSTQRPKVVPIANPTGSETFTALVAVPTRRGTRVFAGTSDGNVELFDGRGERLTTTKLAPRGVIALAASELDGLALVFAACADGTIRVLDSRARLCYGFKTPGTVGSLAVQRRFRGRLWLMGSVREDTRVYVWNPVQMPLLDDASPLLTLAGGRTFAYGGCLIDPGWAAHGGWDGRVCLYELADSDSGSRRPTRVLEAWVGRDTRDPLYAVTATTVGGCRFLFAGGESGVVHGWALDGPVGRGRPQIALRGPRTAVKSLRSVVIGPDTAPWLLAGCRDGSSWQMAPADPDASRRLDEVPPQEAGVDLFEERSW